jgi:hypothetical protein
MAKLHAYLLRIREDVLPKSPAATAVRYALNQWDARMRFLDDVWALRRKAVYQFGRRIARRGPAPPRM